MFFDYKYAFWQYFPYNFFNRASVYHNIVYWSQAFNILPSRFRSSTDVSGEYLNRVCDRPCSPMQVPRKTLRPVESTDTVFRSRKFRRNRVVPVLLSSPVCVRYDGTYDARVANSRPHGNCVGKTDAPVRFTCVPTYASSRDGHVPPGHVSEDSDEMRSRRLWRSTAFVAYTRRHARVATGYITHSGFCLEAFPCRQSRAGDGRRARICAQRRFRAVTIHTSS